MDAIGRDTVIALYKEGRYSRNRLAGMAQCSRSTIDRILTEAGIDLTPRFLPEHLVAGMIASYEAGADLRTVAGSWRVARSTAAQVLRSRGVLRRRGRRPGVGFEQMRNVDPVDVLALHADGGIEAVTRAANCSPATAYRLLRDARAQVIGTPA